MIPLTETLLATLRDQRQTLSTCESLTAGLLAATIADVPGASDVLRGGLITYSNELKTELASVPRELIDAHGAVSPECAEAMALGVRNKLHTDWAVSLTGVAGPGEQEGNPAGVVWLGIAGPDGFVAVEQVLPTGLTKWGLRREATEPEQVLDGDRHQIRQRSVDFAIARLAECVNS